MVYRKLVQKGVGRVGYYFIGVFRGQQQMCSNYQRIISNSVCLLFPEHAMLVKILIWGEVPRKSITWLRLSSTMYGLNFEWRIFMKFLVLISKKRYTVTYKSWPEKLQNFSKRRGNYRLRSCIPPSTTWFNLSFIYSRRRHGSDGKIGMQPPFKFRCCF